MLERETTERCVKQNCKCCRPPSGPLLFVGPVDFFVDSNNPIHIGIDPVLLVQYVESHSIFMYCILSQIHFLLAHTMYKLLRLVQAICTILKFMQKSCVLGEKQKGSIWQRKHFKTFRFAKKAAIDCPFSDLSVSPILPTGCLVGKPCPRSRHVA